MATDILMEKRKNRPQRLFITGMGCLLALGMLLIGGMLGILIGVVILPDYLGYGATQAALATRIGLIDETAIALAGRDLSLANTQSANDVNATQNALDALATLAGLTNQQNLIDQTATSSARDIMATQTSAAVANARQGTQVAIDYVATQAQLQQNATQVELDYQRTQSALGFSVEAQADSQAQVVGMTASATRTASPTQAASRTPAPTRTPSPTITPTEAPRLWLDDDFAGEFDAFVWRSYGDDIWRVQADALEADQSGAWLLSADAFPAPYRLYVGITPSLVDSSNYAVILADEAGTGYALVYEAIGLQVNNIALYEWRFEDTPTWNWEDGRLLVRQSVQGLLIGNTTLVVTVQGGQLRAELNGTTLLRNNIDADRAFGVGVALPMSAQLNKVTVTRLDAP